MTYTAINVITAPMELPGQQRFLLLLNIRGIPTLCPATSCFHLAHEKAMHLLSNIALTSHT